MSTLLVYTLKRLVNGTLAFRRDMDRTDTSRVQETVLQKRWEAVIRDQRNTLVFDPRVTYDHEL